MSDWQPCTWPHIRSHPGDPVRSTLFRTSAPGALCAPDTPDEIRRTPARATAAGAAWLASAAPCPHRVLAHWSARPDSPAVLPCGTAFDVVSAPAVFGRRLVDRLWREGPGSGPVAVHRGRLLLFAAPGTARLLPPLLHREAHGPGGPRGGARAVPPLLCHGAEDAVTVPPPCRSPAGNRPPGEDGHGGPVVSRWLVAPDVRNPWLLSGEVLLWACLRAARGGLTAAERLRTAAVPVLISG